MSWDTQKTFHNAERLVIDVLSKSEDSRGNDLLLIFTVWERQGLKLTDDQKSHIQKCYNPETITRSRRKIQQVGLFKPSIEKQQQRSLLENDFKEYFGK